MYKYAGIFEQWLEPTEPNPEGAERTPVSGKKEKMNKKKKEKAKEDPESMVSLNIMTTVPEEEYQYNRNSSLVDKIIKNGFDDHSVKQVSDLMTQLGFEKEDVDNITQNLTKSILEPVENAQKNTTNVNQQNTTKN